MSVMIEKMKERRAGNSKFPNKLETYKPKEVDSKVEKPKKPRAGTKKE
ncbi:MAG: hypothetical protein FWE25_03325 [Lachnospiraceae bacterium]|nr:hypothetical protein [Lachnospiraceae bacterium]